MGSFFIRYMMQVALIMNMIYLLDLPHFIVKTIKRTCRRNRQASEPFVDTWFFDLGYFQAYTLVLFFLTFLFAVQIPIIGIFGFVFYMFRYQFEKYNMTFVYLKEFEARGRLRKHVVPYQITAIILSQLMNYGFLKVITGEDYMLGIGIGLVCVELAAILAFTIYLYLNKKKFMR